MIPKPPFAGDLTLEQEIAEFERHSPSGLPKFYRAGALEVLDRETRR